MAKYTEKAMEIAKEKLERKGYEVKVKRTGKSLSVELRKGRSVVKLSTSATGLLEIAEWLS